MSGANIVTRTTSKGQKRYIVRYRRGGRGFKLEHAGSFVTLKEAKTRRDLVSGEFAAGRDPKALLATLKAPVRTRTFGQVAAEYQASRIDHAPQTSINMRSHLKRLLPSFESKEPQAITVPDVTEWVAIQALDLKPASLKRYLSTLQLVLDFAGVDPNPARDKRVKLPPVSRDEPSPPSAKQVDAILAHSPARWRLMLRTLEQTGARIGELTTLAWGDVDVRGSRFRLRSQTTKTRQARWVTLPEWLMQEIDGLVPVEDRTAERLVFPGLSADVAKNVMARACRAAGIPHFHPHDLRHRWASVQIQRGVPVSIVRAQLGHAKTSMTLDTYTHVLLEEEA